jgi:hypothetical protein
MRALAIVGLLLLTGCEPPGGGPAYPASPPPPILLPMPGSSETPRPVMSDENMTCEQIGDMVRCY